MSAYLLVAENEKTSQETRKIFRIAKKKHASHQSAREKELENAGEIWAFDERGETIVCAEGGRGKCKEEKKGDCKADVHDLSGKLERCAIPSQFSFYFAV